MEKVFVPSEAINIRKPQTVEEALGISDNRFQHLGFIMDDVWTKHPTAAEALNDIASRPGLTDAEKAYMGYKLHDRICRTKIPFWNQISRGI